MNRDYVLGFCDESPKCPSERLAGRAIKTGAPEVFEGMNERIVDIGHNEDLVDLRVSEPLVDGSDGHHHGEHQKSMMCLHLQQFGLGIESLMSRQLISKKARSGFTTTTV